MKFIRTYFLLITLLISAQKNNAQVLYSESFNNLSLNTATYTTNNGLQTYFYNDVPSSMQVLNEGGLIADTTSGNYPFRANGQKQKGWLVYKPVSINDTVAVSTSWLSPVSTANFWLITPQISNISANTVLTWETISPDASNLESFEVYVSTSTSTTVVSGDFSTMIYNVLSENTTWQKHGISLGSFAGQNIRIGFRHVSSNKYQLWLDDIKVENISTSLDAQAVSHSIYKYSSVNTNNTISAVFKNNGYTPISNLEINYKIGNNATVTEVKILSPPINYLENRTLTFLTSFNTPSAQYADFKIWTGNINNSVDENLANDTITGSLVISTSVPTKKILVEQISSAKDGWTPESYNALKSITTNSNNVIALNMHHNDQVQCAETSTLINDYTINSSESLIDRYYFPNDKIVSITPQNLNAYVTQRSQMTVPATVSITNVSYNTTTRKIDATVSVNFVGDVKGDYYLNLYVKENNVYGPINDSLIDNGWNQYNALYNIPASVYYQYGNNVAGNYLMSSASYLHQNVVDTILDGTYGANAGIPINGSTNGQTYSKNYSYTLPVASGGEFRYNEDNIYLVATLNEYNMSLNNRAVLNCEQVKLNSNAEAVVGVKEYEIENISLSVFPNPANDICNLNYILKSDELITVYIYNTLGELIYIESQFKYAGNVNHVLNTQFLKSGNYSVRIAFKNNTITKKLIIIK
jgi:hypothetical protein